MTKKTQKSKSGPKPVRETQKMLDQIRQLVLDGLDFNNQIFPCLGISESTYYGLMQKPKSRIKEVITQAKGERNRIAHKDMIEYVGGERGDEKLHFAALKHYIDRQDKLEGRTVQRHQIEVSPYDGVPTESFLEQLVTEPDSSND